MNRSALLMLVVLLCLAAFLLTGFTNDGAFWSEWGRDPQHTGMVSISGQPINAKLADIIYDPFTTQEKNETFGELLAHYQATLVDTNGTFFMMQKSGRYPSCQPTGTWIYGFPCGPNAWARVQWNVVRYDWTNGQPQPTWTFATDWKPEPSATNLLQGYSGLVGWEPVFHPALANGYVYVPGAGGTVYRVNKTTGQSAAHINPFTAGQTDPTRTFISGPLTADNNGNIYYNVLELNTNGNPWQQNDISGAWLVKVTPTDATAIVTYATLVPNAPPGTAQCPGTFFNLNDGGASLPWPPRAPLVPPTQRCGSQRPGVNIGPAVAPNGTVYTASVAHFDNMITYLIAVNPDLTPKWASSLQNRLSDGCGVLLPIAPQGVNNLPNSCRYGTRVGVDPTTNSKGSGTIIDQASSTPTVLPDGSILFGVTDNYNYSRGHLMHFDSQGNYLNAYTFGWDSTPAVYVHNGTYSIVIKDNHYDSAAYCSFNSPVCTSLPPGPYYVSQLNANLQVEWSFQNTTIDQQHPNGYEWCVNAPVIDGTGLVYATSEDGSVYSIPQGHSGVFTTPQQKIFLLEAVGAAYTPLSIDDTGREYSQNNGNLFVLGQ